jgi:hypothetical protein
MAAEITEITDCNPPDIHGNDLDGAIAHVITDLHEALRLLGAQGRLLAKHDAMLEEYRPLIERLRSPLASRLPGGRKRHGNV